jgi:hypothetical protein
MGASVGFHYSIPFASYAITGLTIAGIGLAVWIVFRLAIYARAGEENPTRWLMRDLPTYHPFAVGVLLVTLQMAVLNWTKVMLPIVSPFWADPLLADIDHAVFRVDPWIVTNALFGWAAPIIDKMYITWAPLKFAVLACLLVLPESRNKSRALLSYFLILSATAIGQYALSSAGPVFYQPLGLGDRFAKMPVEPWVGTARDYLWGDYLRSGGKVGTGISAMPSLHVAIALWIALVVRAFLPRAAAVVVFAYFVCILIGSVLLGWHYACDGIAACVITLASWRVASVRASSGFQTAQLSFANVAAE